MADAVTNFFAKIQRRRNVNKTINELNALSNSELNDIGINRGMIRSIAESSYPTVEMKNENTNLNIRDWV